MARRKDEEIKKDVTDALYWNSRIDSSGVSVSVSDGVVNLSGTVPSYGARNAAAGEAWSVAGVHSVVDHLAVGVPDGIALPDDEQIQEKAESLLAWNADVDDEGIRVTVRDGKAVLEGTVETYWQRREAAEIVGGLSGIMEVENELSVVPTGDLIDRQIAEEIVGAIERNPVVDAEDVSVEVEDGVVALSGSLPSWVARQAAYDAALYTRGVVNLEDMTALRV